MFAQPVTRINPYRDAAMLTALHAKMEPVLYKGRKAIRVTELKDNLGEPTVRINGLTFHDGSIEVWVAGKPREGAFADARGYVGISFRVSDDNRRFECFYLRPTNGRADDQVRRNHALQYTSTPDYPWFRLRKENPEKYESYADLVPGEWTKIRIEVKGEKAKLYIGDAQQPGLIVNDLKMGADAFGGVALWIGLDTEAWFSDIRVTPE